MRAHFLVAAVPLVALACFDRLGADPQFDAGLTLDAGAFDSSSPDGAAPDGPVDAPVDSGPSPVKVQVLKGGLPESGVNVVFQDAAGAVVEAKTTATDGTASRVVDPGTMVTVALGAGDSRQLVTVLGVKPGDTLTALDDANGTAFVGFPVSVDLPGSPPPGTLSYDAHSGACAPPGTGAGPLLYFVRPECQRAGKFPVLAFANDRNDLPVGFSFKKGNTGSVDGGTTQVTALPAWATPGSVSVTATNAGTDAGSGVVVLGYTEIADGIGFPASTSMMPSLGTAMATLETHPGYADAVQTEAGRSAPVTSSLTSLTSIAKRAAPPATGTSFDLSQLLPAMTNAVLDTSDVSRPSVTLTLTSIPTNADGLVAQMAWSATGDGGVTTYGQWLIIAPPTTTTVKAPAMPAALSAWLAPTGAFFDLPTAVILDSDQIPGYDQLRGLFAGFPLPATFAPMGAAVPPLPSTGTVRVSALVPTPM